MDVLDIVKRVQVELQDVGQSWATQDLIIARLPTVNEDVCMELEAMDLAFQVAVITVPAVPANTTDLSQYQISGGPLYGLVVPRLLEWRLVGQNDEQWNPVQSVDKVLDTNRAAGGSQTASDQAGIASCEWRGGVMVISPSNQPTDIRVRGEFLPPLLQNDTETPIVGLTNPLVYKTAWKILRSRAELSNLANDMDEQYKKAVDAYEVMQVKEQQNRPQRFGSRRNASGEFAGGTAPTA